MRSAVFFTIFGLFPVLISGFPFLRVRDGNDTSTPSNSTDAAPIDGEPVNSTASDLGTQLLTLNLLTVKAFYEQAGAISQGLNDTNTSAILGIGALINNGQLTLLLAMSTVLLIFTPSWILQIQRTASVLGNASFELDQTEQDTITGIYQESSQLSALAIKITDPSVPMDNHPNLTMEDYASILYKFNPSCRNDLGIPNITTHIQQGYSVPYQVSSGFLIGAGNAGCPNSTAQAFCQMVGPGANATSVTPIVGNSNCSMHVANGPSLFFVTQVETPLSSDPVERQLQEGDICSGPDVLMVNPF